ncbi:TetR/AcrR family transcriptional regulator [Pedobacter faecalis]|uniref:TetR/AcrR family transcriptional regulator n=1 Tax=Pedobacter faecalis TaxID=3041495 RepID=UPI00254E8D99|nr:TetR family transcriptional regulator [Pedobacter sp. ELA7]
MRDKDRTKALLLEAASRIVKEKGFEALNASAIGREAGRAPTAVNQAFGSFRALMQTYVEGKDHWRLLFEGVGEVSGAAVGSGVSAGAGLDVDAAGLKDLFVRLMQDNLKVFWEDPEMQVLIARQMTVKDKLMRAVSDKRELEARRLLALTDKYFAGTDVSFKSVLAVVLYGCYGLVLHAHNNGSTVSGIDINNDREFEVLNKTIEQILGWAWEAVGEGDGFVVAGSGDEVLNPGAVVPASEIESQFPLYWDMWSRINYSLRGAGASPELVNLAGIPFRKFKVNADVRWSDYHYLIVYNEALVRLVEDGFGERGFGVEAIDVDSLLRLYLVGLGFNSVRFAAYYVEYLQGLVAGLDVADRVRVLREQWEQIARAELMTELRYNRYRPSVDASLLEWIDEKLALLAEGTGA